MKAKDLFTTEEISFVKPIVVGVDGEVTLVVKNGKVLFENERSDRNQPFIIVGICA